jgi:hypothetical protein
MLKQFKNQIIAGAVQQYARKMPANGIAGMAVHTAAKMMSGPAAGTSTKSGSGITKAVGGHGSKLLCEQAAVKAFGNNFAAKEAGRRAYSLLNKIT